jgi:hypothetical protein
VGAVEDLPLMELYRYRLARHGRVLVPIPGEQDGFWVYDLLATRDGWREVLLRYAGRQLGGGGDDRLFTGLHCSPVSTWVRWDSERMRYVSDEGRRS